jgi:hypothetical protein
MMDTVLEALTYLFFGLGAVLSWIVKGCKTTIGKSYRIHTRYETVSSLVSFGPQS